MQNAVVAGDWSTQCWLCRYSYDMPISWS